MVTIIFFFCICLFILDDIKGLIGVKRCKISHCASEDSDDMRNQAWNSSILSDIYLNNMITLRKSQQENAE